MTTPINTFEDILEAMERDPALRDTLRRHILTDELLQMPLRLEQFITEQRDFNSNSLTRLDRMEGDSGNLKGHWARNTAVSDAAGIAHDMGLEFVRNLTPSDLMELAGDQLEQGYRPELPKGRPGYRGHQGRGPAICRTRGLVHRRPAGLREGDQERRAPDTVHWKEGRQPALPASETPTRSSSSWNQATPATGTRWRTGPQTPE